jgi:hypothetical protein
MLQVRLLGPEPWYRELRACRAGREYLILSTPALAYLVGRDWIAV